MDLRLVLIASTLAAGAAAAADPEERVYENRLEPVFDPAPILAAHPEFVEPLRETRRFAAPPVIADDGADLEVRAWRFSYNARGVIEMTNRLRGDRTAVVVVHPWGIDDGQGWRSPEPAGCAFQCTPEKNALCRRHAREVIDPLVRRLRGRVKHVVFSLPGTEDAVRRKLYRSVRARSSAADRVEGARELAARLGAFDYRGEALPESFTVSNEHPTAAYFKSFPGLDPGPRYNHAGFWELPIPVMKDIAVGPDDVVIYDGEGYEPLRDFLKASGVRHVILAGYNTDMCVISTTAGHQNLRRDFDVLLAGDATIATFPAHSSPAPATSAAVAFASLNMLITESGWIRSLAESKP